LREIAARGLFYVDDGTSARSLAMTLAPGQELAAARADIVLDSTAQPEAIEAASARLEPRPRKDWRSGLRAHFRLPSKLSAVRQRTSMREVCACAADVAAMPRRQQDLAISTVRQAAMDR